MTIWLFHLCFLRVLVLTLISFPNVKRGVPNWNRLHPLYMFTKYNSIAHSNSKTNPNTRVNNSRVCNPHPSPEIVNINFHKIGDTSSIKPNRIQSNRISDEITIYIINVNNIKTAIVNIINYVFVDIAYQCTVCGIRLCYFVTKYVR